MMEIERKFTLKKLPEKLTDYPCRKLCQGYLCTGPVVRIRKSEQDGEVRYILCYKAKIGTLGKEKERMAEGESKFAKVNEEVELPLTESSFATLLKKVEGRVIEKTRYLIPYREYLIELDVFEGELSGLYFAEVEFPDGEHADSFEPPEWFDRDVSNDKRYRNSYLATAENVNFPFAQP